MKTKSNFLQEKGKSIIVSPSSLVFLNTAPSHAGLYTCENVEGGMKKDFKLIVNRESCRIELKSD
jgi:hypothetical protein